MLYTQFFLRQQFVPLECGVTGALDMMTKFLSPILRAHTRKESRMEDKVLPLIYLLWKNKEPGIAKLRPITTHRLHPGRPLARLVGRALSTLLLYGVSCSGTRIVRSSRESLQFFPQEERNVPCLECPSMEQFLDFVQWVKNQWQCAELTGKTFSMVELDLDDMYSNIPREAAFAATQWFMSVLKRRW